MKHTRLGHINRWIWVRPDLFNIGWTRSDCMGGTNIAIPKWKTKAGAFSEKTFGLIGLEHQPTFIDIILIHAALVFLAQSSIWLTLGFVIRKNSN